MIDLDEIKELRELLNWKLGILRNSPGKTSDIKLTILSLKLLQSLTSVAEDYILEDMKKQAEKSEYYDPNFPPKDAADVVLPPVSDDLDVHKIYVTDDKKGLIAEFNFEDLAQKVKKRLGKC